MRYIIQLLLLGFLFGSPARAAWHEASSDHFLIYSDQSEKKVRAFAERLERYHETMRFLFSRDGANPSPSNRVTIYAVKNVKQVRKLLGGNNKWAAGFYIPRAGGSLAIIPEVKPRPGKMSPSELILLHEYAHHFLLASSSRAYPRWLSEGFAEFYGTAKFSSDGSVSLGLASRGRAYELSLSREVPIELLLDTGAYTKSKKAGRDSFYGQSWALYHMLHFSDERDGQLARYVSLLAQGKDELSAAKTAFGDLELLDRDLSRYLKQRKIWTYQVPANRLRIGAISTRRLGPGEEAIMPVLIRSKRGVNKEMAAELVLEAREIAAGYGNDPAVLAALAEAEFDAGNDSAAIAAANKALALDPRQVNAHIQKGYALARMAADAEDQTVAWREVRKQFVRVNKIENDHPIPLIQYYLSYRGEGKKIPDIAKRGLERALELAPYDQALRWMVAQQLMEDHNFPLAAFVLKPLAHNPHQSKLTERAAQLLAEAEKKAAVSGKSDNAANAAGGGY